MMMLQGSHYTGRLIPAAGLAAASPAHDSNFPLEIIISK
jgi:hypothetical protein